MLAELRNKEDRKERRSRKGRFRTEPPAELVGASVSGGKRGALPGGAKT